MKGLLHSKLFRKNLFTWLFMYITVIGLFTSVVTYSKYISRMQEKDNARVAKFYALITYDDICTDINENQTEACNVDAIRPTSNMTYRFTVDTTNFEVTSKFTLSIKVAELFKNVKIYDITDTKKELEFVETEGKNDKFSTIYKYHEYTLTDEELKPNETNVRKYEMTMDFDYDTYDPDHKTSHSYYELITVGYLAEQIK